MQVEKREEKVAETAVFIVNEQSRMGVVRCPNGQWALILHKDAAERALLYLYSSGALAPDEHELLLAQIRASNIPSRSGLLFSVPRTVH